MIHTCLIISSLLSLSQLSLSLAMLVNNWRCQTRGSKKGGWLSRISAFTAHPWVSRIFTEEDLTHLATKRSTDPLSKNMYFLLVNKHQLQKELVQKKRFKALKLVVRLQVSKRKLILQACVDFSQKNINMIENLLNTISSQPLLIPFCAVLFLSSQFRPTNSSLEIPIEPTQ